MRIEFKSNFNLGLKRFLGTWVGYWDEQKASRFDAYKQVKTLFEKYEDHFDSD